MATYYIRSGGSDAASGTSDANAWETLSRVNTAWSDGTIVAGDVICFRRGDSWYGTLTAGRSGTSGNRITVTAYGSGDKPIITGLTTLSSWTNVSGGLYYATTNLASQTNMVVINNQDVGMGRFPKAGTNLDYTTCTNTSIYDATLSNSPSWVGAEVVINKDPWVLDRCMVTGHNNGTITFTNTVFSNAYGTVSANRYYFFQNHLQCVTEENEWYHDVSANRLYVYGNPSGKIVQIATLNHLVQNSSYSYIIFENLDLRGSIQNGFNLSSSGANNCIVRNCDVRHTGRKGIYSSPGSNSFDNNHVQHCNEGMHFDNGTISITGNYVHHIGLIPGASMKSNVPGMHLGGTPHTYVAYNRVSYTATNNIGTASNASFYLYRNFLTHAMQVTDDGGNFYTTASSGTRVLEENICLYSGHGAPDYVKWARGIYCDAASSGVTIINNVVGFARESGLMIHANDNHILTGNISFGCGLQAMFQKYLTNVSENVTFQDNILVAVGSTDRTMSSYVYTLAEIQNWGNFNNNIYARPILDTDHTYYRTNGSSQRRILAQWKSDTGHDASTTGSPISISSEDEAHLVYNDSNSAKTYTLSAPMTDMYGAIVSGNIVLQPFSGRVLLGAGTISEWVDPNPTIIYVSTDGSDGSGNGTYEYPYRTIPHGISMAGNGDTIHILAGTYAIDTQIILPVGVNLRGDGESTVITTTYTNASSLQGAIQLASTVGITTNGNQTLSYFTLDGSQFVSTRAIFVGYRNNVTIHNITIKDFIHSGIYFYVSATYPTLYAIGNRIHDCYIESASHRSSGFTGAIRLVGQAQIEVDYNIIDMTKRALGHNGNSFSSSRCKKVKIHHNTLYRNDTELDQWNFFMENWTYRGDFEYYDNIHYGLAKASLGGDGNGQEEDCTFGAKVYRNYFYNDNVGSRTEEGSIEDTKYCFTIEGDEHINVLVTQNYIQNYAWGIEISTPTSGVGYWAHNWIIENIVIAYNVIDGVGYDDHNYSYGILFINETNNSPYVGTFNNVSVFNNTIKANNGPTYDGWYGISLRGNGTWNNLKIQNNIVVGFRQQSIHIDRHATDDLTVNGLLINNNCSYNNGSGIFVNSGAFDLIGTVDISTGNITSNPLFIGGTPYSYELHSGSPCINTGIDVGLTEDYTGKSIVGVPDIGAFEFQESDVEVSLDTPRILNFGVL